MTEHNQAVLEFMRDNGHDYFVAFVDRETGKEIVHVYDHPVPDGDGIFWVHKITCPENIPSVLSPNCRWESLNVLEQAYRRQGMSVIDKFCLYYFLRAFHGKRPDTFYIRVRI